MNHYTYCLTVDNFFYWGVRSCSCSPEKDINYMSSSKLVQAMRLRGIQFKKEIVTTFNSRKGAELKEIFHLFINNIGDNRAWLVNKFYDETKSKLKKLYTTDEFKIITNELKSLE